MTENEKLDLILEKVQKIEKEMKTTKDEVQGLKSEIQAMKSEMLIIKSDMQLLKEEVLKVKSDLREAVQKIDKLAVGQMRLQREIYRVDRKITDTYNLALDAWGQSVENRAWLEGKHTTWLEGGMLQN